MTVQKSSISISLWGSFSIGLALLASPEKSRVSIVVTIVIRIMMTVQKSSISISLWGSFSIGLTLLTSPEKSRVSVVVTVAIVRIVEKTSICFSLRGGFSLWLSFSHRLGFSTGKGKENQQNQTPHSSQNF